jgi:hypothetical protein
MVLCDWPATGDFFGEYALFSEFTHIRTLSAEAEKGTILCRSGADAHSTKCSLSSAPSITRVAMTLDSLTSVLLWS